MFRYRYLLGFTAAYLYSILSFNNPFAGQTGQGGNSGHQKGFPVSGTV
jgi:hypothetical protein